MAWFGATGSSHRHSTHRPRPDSSTGSNPLPPPVSSPRFQHSPPTTPSLQASVACPSEDCHIHPACKSTEETKGTQRLRSSWDVSSNYRLVSWRVVDAKPTGLKKLSESSATRILDHLGSNNDAHYYLDCDDHNADEFYESVMESAAVEMEDNFDDEDDDEMSSCDVGLTWENTDGVDDDWCSVENNLIV